MLKRRYKKPRTALRAAILGAAGWVLICVVGLLLSACDVAPARPILPIKPTPTPLEVRAAAASKLLVTLQQQGLQVVHIGETLRLLLPSDALFVQQSSNFQQETSPQLDTVVALLRVLEAPKVSIVGYTDNLGVPRQRQLVSERQAENVMDYLVSRQIDARLVSAKGVGPQDAIASNQTPAGRAKNRRIEIRFQYLSLLMTTPSVMS